MGWSLQRSWVLGLGRRGLRGLEGSGQRMEAAWLWPPEEGPGQPGAPRDGGRGFANAP